MGYNTTVVVLNDALHHIRDDKNFGQKLYDAISMLSLETGKPQYVSAGCHCNAAAAIEQHHASGQAVVAIGGNTGTVLGHAFCDQDQKLAIIKQLAESMGYTLRKRPQR